MVPAVVGERKMDYMDAAVIWHGISHVPLPRQQWPRFCQLQPALQRSQKSFWVLKTSIWIQFICFAQYLLKACIKGTIFALEEFFPSVLVTVMTPNALYVTRGEFTKFTVKDGFCFFHSCSTHRKWDWADVVVPGQSCRLVVIQLLLNIRRLGVWRVCRETEGSCYSRWINKYEKVWGLLQHLLAFRGGWSRFWLWNPWAAFWRE